MDFLIPNAWAAGAPAQGNALAEMLPLLILFVVFYLFLIRPQMKKAKEQRQMVDALQKGDEVVTSGGLLGRITQIGDNFLVLEVSKGIELKVQRQAVSQVLPKGTLKTL